jgi:membrane associated rhomboid family serine protease
LISHITGVPSLTIGASGSVFGLLLAFAMIFPNIPLYIMFIPIPIKAKYMAIGYGVLEFFLGMGNRAGDNVAHFAHLGGMLFGIFLILYWRKKGTGYDKRFFQ